MARKAARPTFKAGDIVRFLPRTNGLVIFGEENRETELWEVLPSHPEAPLYLRLTTDHSKTCGASQTAVTLVTEGK